MSIQIRLMHEDELDAVARVFHESKRAALTFLPAEMARTLDDDRGYLRDFLRPKADIRVALIDGAVVGFIALAGDHIEQLYVDTDRQRAGVGSAMIDHAKSLSPSGLTVYTHQKNTRARRFYEKHGFTAERFGASPAPESEPDVFYSWSPAGDNT